MKKLYNNLSKLVFLFALSMIAALSLPSMFFVFANDNAEPQTLTPTIFGQSSNLTYHYLNDPLLVSANSEYLAVADKLEDNSVVIVIFDLADYSLKSELKLNSLKLNAMFLTDAKLYTVEDGNIYSYPLTDFEATPQSLLVISKDENPDFDSGFSGIYVSETSQEDEHGTTIITTEIFASCNEYIYHFDDSKQVINTMFGSFGTIRGFTALSDNIFAFVDGRNSNLSSVIRQGFNQTDANYALLNTEYIECIGTNLNSLTLLTRSSLSLYELGLFEINKTKSTASHMIIISNAGLYGIDSLGSVFKFDDELSKFDEIIAASSTNEDFFNNPNSIATRFEKVYIADKNNDRIIIKSNSKSQTINNIIRPIAVTLDANESLYVAFKENHITKFDAELTRLTNETDEVVQIKANNGDVSPLLDTIIDIKTDSKENLYLITRSFDLYKQNPDLTFSKILENVTDIEASPLNSYIFVVQNDTLIRLLINQNDNSISSLKTQISGNILDITIDADDKIYVLKSGNSLERFHLNGLTYQNDGFTALIDTSLQIKKIAVSLINIDALGYRDLVVIDPERSGVFVLTHDKLGISNEGINDKETLTSTNATALSNSVQLIRTLTRSCAVYVNESEVNVITTLPKGYRVLVNDFDQNRKFTKIIADNSLSHSSQIIVGYVNTSYLSAPLEYKSPPQESYNVWLHAIPLYTYPSTQSPKINGFETVAKNTPVTLLSFVHQKEINNTFEYGYRDNFYIEESQSEINSLWFRLKITFNNEDCEAFVPAANLSVMGADPDPSVRPQTNATIISKDKNFPNLGAYVYMYIEETDEYELDPRYSIIEVGTKVEVVGAFDESAKFTKIRFYTGNGTAEVFVETANIKYEGVKVGQIIAFILLFITLVMLFILLLRYAKKKRENKIV